MSEGHRKPEGSKREIVQKAQFLCIICCSLAGRLNCKMIHKLPAADKIGSEL